jgi:hypothetical protein
VHCKQSSNVAQQAVLILKSGEEKIKKKRTAALLYVQERPSSE